MTGCMEVFDNILKDIVGEEKMEQCRFIICSECMAMGKDDRGFREIGEGFKVNDDTEECSHLFGDESDDEHHSIEEIYLHGERHKQ